MLSLLLSVTFYILWYNKYNVTSNVLLKIYVWSTPTIKSILVSSLYNYLYTVEAYVAITADLGIFKGKLFDRACEAYTTYINCMPDRFTESLGTMVSIVPSYSKSLDMQINIDLDAGAYVWLVTTYLILRKNTYFLNWALVQTVIIHTRADSQAKTELSVGSSILWRDSKPPTLQEWLSHYIPVVISWEKKGESYSIDLHKVNVVLVLSKDITHKFL